jgi:hypothetical protein
VSSFIGNASGGTAGVGSFARDDIRIWAEWSDHSGTVVWVPVDDCWVLDGFRTGWWPGRGGMDASGGEWCAPVWWDRPEITRGHSGRLGFRGVTRDVYGTAVPGTVVKLFRTADDSLQSQQTSASDGSFTLTTPYSDGHYMVAYKDDVIDTAGATVNTLIPA